MLQPVFRKSFDKDVKRAKKRGKAMDKLKLILRLLLEEKPIPLKCRDHALSGNYSNHRECHIEPDWLLIYKSEPGLIIFERTGTHADLFR